MTAPAAQGHPIIGADSSANRLLRARRILVIGSPGSGKSTLARQLGPVLGLPVVHLDALYHRPDWQTLPHDDFDRLLDTQLREPAWIIDGLYQRTLEHRLRFAEAVIFVDLPRRYCLYRALRRGITDRHRQRPDLPIGARDRVSTALLRQIWTYPNEVRPRVVELLRERQAHLSVVQLRSPRAVSCFLQRAAPGKHVESEC